MIRKNLLVVLALFAFFTGIIMANAAQYYPPWAHLHYHGLTYKLSWADGWVDEMGYNSYSVKNLSSVSAYNYWKSDSLFIFAGHGIAYNSQTAGGGMKFTDNSGNVGWILAEDTTGSEVNNSPNVSMG